VSPIEANLLSAASSEPRPAPPCVMVLFGATGDLAARKIAPAIYNLGMQNLLSDRFVVLGVARRPRTDEEFRREMLRAVRKFSRTQPVNESAFAALAARWHYQSGRANEPGDYQALGARLKSLDAQYGTGGSRLYYLATPPENFPQIIGNLGSAGLARPPEAPGPGGEAPFVRIVVEKPFGRDLLTARNLNRLLLSCFQESQVFRIDHYLGKETVQNILVFRFGNAIFDALFSRQHVDRVQISTTETVGMEERRGPYYDAVGALRDMVQNHMLQVLSLIAMDPPTRIDAESVRQEKARVLRCLRIPTPSEAAESSVRGQYAGGRDSPAYRREPQVPADSQTETFAAVRLYIDNWRWAGVPFYLRTGKRLARKVSEVGIFFKREPIGLFDATGCDLRGPNQLWIRIAPEEGITQVFDAKVPGTRMVLRPVRMDFRYETAFRSSSPEAYELLLLDAALGEPMLFIRDDEVEASWRFIDGIRGAWSAGKPELLSYEPGSWGPPQADGLFGDPYKHWQVL